MCIEFWKLLLPAHFALLETWISWVELGGPEKGGRSVSELVSSLEVKKSVGGTEIERSDFRVGN